MASTSVLERASASVAARDELICCIVQRSPPLARSPCTTVHFCRSSARMRVSLQVLQLFQIGLFALVGPSDLLRGNQCSLHTILIESTAVAAFLRVSSALRFAVALCGVQEGSRTQ
eukprot:IDg23876t1